MTTQQKYSAQDNTANSSEQPVKPVAQSLTAAHQQPAKLSPFFSPVTNDDQKRIQERYRELHEAVDEFMTYHSGASLAELIHDFYVGWSLYYFGEERKTMTIHTSVMDEFHSALALLKFVTKISETWSAIEDFEEQYASQQSQVFRPIPTEQVSTEYITKDKLRQHEAASNLITVDRSVYNAQAGIIDLVNDFLDRVSATTHIQGVTDLLYDWIARQNANFNLQPNRDQLHSAFQLTSFLMALNEQMLNLKSLTNQTDKE